MIVDKAQVADALPGYDLGATLGAGGSGLVLAGRHRGLNRPVAIKVLDAARDRATADFAAEAQLLAAMNHPHVVQVYDYVETDDLHLIVMELLAGGTLTHRQTADMSPQDACAVGLAVAAALAYAHSQKVLHRDIKPDNILFDVTGLLKVTDFGIAKIVDGSGATASRVVGTAAYMAPEQITGGRLTPATDLYALGIVLYQLFAGAPPFDRKLPLHVLAQRHLDTVPPPPAGVPAPLADVVMRMLAKNPAERQPSAHAFALDLARAAAEAYGPRWTTRSGIALRLDDDIRAAADQPSLATQMSLPPTVPPSGNSLPPGAPPSGGSSPPEPPRWKSWARRRVLGPLALILTAALVGVTIAQVNGDSTPADCRSRADGSASLSWVGGQCVGYSDGGYTFTSGGTSPHAVELRSVQEKIYEQNRCAKILHDRTAAELGYRLVTLVYFAGLTGETDGSWTAAQVAELEGLLTWQRALNQVKGSPGGCASTSENPARVALRVVIANGGNGMTYADEVANDHLLSLASRPEENLLGVIGMDRSNPETGRAITTLGGVGVPVVATTLSGDGMPSFSPLSYFQMVPSNRRQALLATSYARKNAKKRISVYYPEGSDDPTGQGLPPADDYYLSSLVADIQDEVRRAAQADPATGFAYDAHGWAPGGNTADWFRAQCATQHPNDDLIFYAGRYDDFPAFVDNMLPCLGPGQLVLGDDSVSRYVVQAAGYSSTAVFRFVSKGASVLLAGKACFQGQIPASAGAFVSPSLRDFCTRLDDMYKATGMPVPETLWPDERIGLAYDAAKLFVDIVKKRRDATMKDIGGLLRGPFPGDEKCADTASSTATAWPGATGCVDFGTSQVAESKRLAVIRIKLDEKDLPASPDPKSASKQDVEAVDGYPCKYVISGQQPSTTDCLGNPLPPLLPSRIVALH
ncbi:MULTISPECIES: serine/threonine-protein kinase [unclassified Frankia]|uniref:serine/threonine-protein kinase n=1 Tax=unclassified Frankia TaxID=2632575 RepID=UPI001EF73891|nr:MULTISPECIES: serine/threonine-protein kinase [unclassified Frankia]